MKILIAGGFGFIGSNIVQSLISEGHDITVIDDLSTGRELVSKDIRFYRLSTDDKRCEEVFKETAFDMVMYLAFRGYSHNIYEGKANNIHINNAGLSNILSLSHKYNIKKIIGFSSCIQPSTPEGESYLARECLFEEYRRIGLNIITLKVGAVYGPGQYGTDSNYIDDILKNNTAVNMEIEKEYIYIQDLCKAVIKVVENDTKDSLIISSGVNNSNKDIFKIYSKYLNNEPIEDEELIVDKDYKANINQTLLELDWVPKVDIIKGIKKTMDWYKKSSRQDLIKKEETLTKDKIVIRNKRISKTLENIILFTISAGIHYISQYKFAIKVDFLLLYIIFTNLIYGLQEGILALGLSIFTFILFKFNFEEKTALILMRDINTILYLTTYGVIGTSIGYLVDELKVEKKYLSNEVDFYKGEMKFLRELYSKVIEVKNNLQFSIENYEDNFSKTYTIVDRLDKKSTVQIFDGIVDIYASIFNVKNVSIYCLNSDSTWLRLISYLGDGRHGNSINISKSIFFSSVIKEGDLYINKELDKRYPTICIPIIYGKEIIAMALLDDIEFKNLTQKYLNSLKVVTKFISNSLSAALEYEKAIEDKRYYSNTVIMKKEWFDKLIEEKMGLNEARTYGIPILKINHQIRDYQSFNNKVSKLIRSNDILGEIKVGQLAIIPSMVVSQGISIISERLSNSGIDVEVSYLGGE